MQSTELPQLLGHSAQEAALLSMLERKKLPHTLLFHGPQGIGKASLAKQLSGYLLGGASADASGLFGPASLAVDVNSAPMRRVLNGSHGDLKWIEPELSGQNQTPIIKVNAAREAALFLSKTAAEADWRIVVIDGADALNVNAANALLKIVEEPPLNALMILIAHQPGKILPTVRSRCRKLAFLPPKAADFEVAFRRENPTILDADLQVLYVLSAGSPGRALELESAGAPEIYRSLLELLVDYPRFSSDAVQASVLAAEKRSKEGGFALWCQLWLRLIERLALSAAGALSGAMSADEPRCLAQATSRTDPAFWGQLHSQSAELIGRAAGLHLDRKAVIPSLVAMAFQQLELAA